MMSIRYVGKCWSGNIPTEASLCGRVHASQEVNMFIQCSSVKFKWVAEVPVGGVEAKERGEKSTFNLIFRLPGTWKFCYLVTLSSLSLRDKKNPQGVLEV